MLRQGITLNTQNAPLNHDMTLVIDRVGEALVPASSHPRRPLLRQRLRPHRTRYARIFRCTANPRRNEALS